MLTRLVQHFPALQRELGPMATFLARRYKDAPLAIRPQEASALRKQRQRAKAKAAANAPTAPVASSSERGRASGLGAPHATHTAIACCSAVVVAVAMPAVTSGIEAPQSPAAPVFSVLHSIPDAAGPLSTG